MIKRILIGIGGTPFTTVAIRRAVELARLHGAQVTAVTIVDEARLRRLGPVPLGSGAAARELREHRILVTREKIDAEIVALEEQCVLDAVPLTVLREHDNPFMLLMQHARYHDLMVFGLRSMFEYDIFGGNDVEPAIVLNSLAKAGVCPILAVSEKYRTICRALFAYDGSMQAAQAMKQFVRFHLWPDLALRILACNGQEKETQQLSDDARAYCLSHGVDATSVHCSGTAHEEILKEAASWNADLVVLGCSGRGQIVSRLFGSTALHVLRHADLPLFLSQ
ncbi:MAG: universal stress protein [Pirellulales bacterium]|nr:universal stress protein [Pirellulales bacterium]